MSNKLDEAREIINRVDSQMAELFIERMHAVEMVFEHKKELGLPIFDAEREEKIIQKNSALIEDEVIKEYYIEYIKNLMEISREYQYRMENDASLN
jgi:monofunctional chorismate mutase